MKKPNVLFLFSDEHNAKCLGHEQHPDVRTPNLDRLASQGVRFNRAVPQSPICTPSRISFASGQYPHNHGYYGLAGNLHGRDLMENIPHLYSHFQQNGYRVGAVGKSHLPPQWIEPYCDRFVEDKDVEFGYPAFLRRQGIDPKSNKSLNWGKNADGKPDGKFNHDFGPDDLSYDLSAEHWEAAEAVDFIKTHQEEPFFLQVGFWRPHTPCTPSPEFWDMYPEEELTEPPNADYEMHEKSEALRVRREQMENQDPEKFRFAPQNYQAMRRRYLRAYYGVISQVDHAIGEILTALDELGLAENTIIVYTSDHGDFAGEHGLVEKAPGIWADAVTRIPFIWRWPQHFKPGHTSERLVESVDLAPTLCNLAELPAMPTADGHDISSLLKGDDTPVREIAVTENPWSCAVYDERYRYVHSVPETGEASAPPQLYDLKEDPWEMHNLGNDPDHLETLQRLRKQLLDWTMTTRRLVTTHPSLTPDGQAGGSKQHGRQHWVDADGKRGPEYVRQVKDKCGNAYL